MTAIGTRYRLVKLAGGAHSVHSIAHHETFHPVVGPVAEAEVLYVRQLDLLQRVRSHTGEFVLWDVGLGAAANVITALRATRELRCKLRVISFDHTLEPLAFALENVEHLTYLEGYQSPLRVLLENTSVQFRDGSQEVRWEVHVADFPTLLSTPGAASIEKPHAILFDAFSPAKNPEMWSQPLFARLYSMLDPKRPCAMPTYSRSTMLRCTLLLAGFFVGIGHATGEKEQTTIAANRLELLTEPLDRRWLDRARRSTSAEPMWEAHYRQAPLSARTWEHLCNHPQFR